MNTQVDGIAIKEHHSEIVPSKRPIQFVPQPGDVLASERTARADVYTISIVPAAAHLRATRYSEAIEKVRELAGRLGVDGWFTCNHRHYLRIASFREYSLRCRTAMQRFHATSAHAPPHGFLSGVQRLVNSDVQHCVSPLDDDTGEPAEDNFHSAFLVRSAARPIGIPRANGHPLDRPGELPQLQAQLPPDVGVIIVTQCDTCHAQVRRNRRGATATPLEWPGHRRGQNSPPAGRYEVTDLL